MELKAFIEQYGSQLAACIEDKLAPVYNPAKPEGVDEFEQKIEALLRKPFPVQAEIIKGVSKALYKESIREQFIVGEMGTGKTMLALSVIAMSPKPQRALVVCPTHLVKKWIREAKKTIPDVLTVDLSVKKVISVLEVLRSERKRKPDTHEIFVISKEKAKLSYGWRGAAINKADSEVPHCPRCGSPAVDLNDNYLTFQEVKRKRRTCSCGEQLWQAEKKLRRFAPAEYIKKYLKGYFDLIVLDEVHDFKAGDSLQGRAMGMLLSSVRRSLCLTGTLNGGYADDLFYLLFRMDPAGLKRDGFHYQSSTKWQDAYGVLQEVKKIEEDENYYGRGKKSGRMVKKRPGVSPLVVGRYLLDKSSFIRLSDVASDLPPYEESVVTVSMDDEQRVEYNLLQGRLQDAVDEYGSLALASMLQALLSYPDSCCSFSEHIEIKDKETKDVLAVIQAPQLECNSLLPKEAELVSIANQEKKKGRKTLCYLTFTNSRDIRPRLKQALKDTGLRVGVLDASVEPKKREDWIQQHSEEIDVLLVNPELVKTGLDLYQFPTVVFFQTGYNIFTVRQAARRSWRIGQTQPVKVYFLCYENTMQEVALYLVADKLETALMVEGELPDGLADYGSSSSSVFEELAGALVSGDTYSADAKWAGFRQREAEINTELMVQTESGCAAMSDSADDHVVVKVSLKEKGKKRRSVDVTLAELNNSEEYKNRPVQLTMF